MNVTCIDPTLRKLSEDYVYLNSWRKKKYISHSNLNMGTFRMNIPGIWFEVQEKIEKLNLTDDSIGTIQKIICGWWDVPFASFYVYRLISMVFWAEWRLNGHKIVPIIDLRMSISMTSSCLQFLMVHFIHWACVLALIHFMSFHRYINGINDCLLLEWRINILI